MPTRQAEAAVGMSVEIKAHSEPVQGRVGYDHAVDSRSQHDSPPEHIGFRRYGSKRSLMLGLQEGQGHDRVTVRAVELPTPVQHGVVGRRRRRQALQGTRDQRLSPLRQPDRLQSKTVERRQGNGQQHQWTVGAVHRLQSVDPWLRVATRQTGQPTVVLEQKGIQTWNGGRLDRRQGQFDGA